METSLISPFAPLVLFVWMSSRCGVMLIFGTLRRMQMLFLLRRWRLINGDAAVAVQSRSCSPAERFSSSNYPLFCLFLPQMFAKSALVLMWEMSEDLTFSCRQRVD